MRSIRRILVAIKDYEAGETAAVAKAAQLARALGARLELFHAISTPLYVDGFGVTGVELPQIENNLRARVEAHLEKLAARLRRGGLRVATAAEWDYPAYEAIVRRAGRIKADMIVADQHDNHRAASFLRLTDWELLRLSPVPVLLIKTPGVYRRPVVLAAVDPGHSFAKPTRLDQVILDASALVARSLGGTQHVLHAYVPFPFAADPQTLISQDTIDRLEREATQSAERTLSRELRAKRIPKSRQHVVGRHPADAIAQTARDLNSAIVVMGAVSRSGLKRLVIGNTAERSLDLLGCDVLILKPAHFANRVPRTLRGARLRAVGSLAAPF